MSVTYPDHNGGASLLSDAAHYSSAANETERLILLLSGPTIAFRREFVKPAGGMGEALFLSQAIYWTRKLPKGNDGWFWKTQEQWAEELGATRYEQETIRKNLRKRGILLEKKSGIPSKLFFKVDLAALAKSLAGVDLNDPTDANNPLSACGDTACGVSTCYPAETLQTGKREHHRHLEGTEITAESTPVERDAPPTTPTATASPYEDYDPREPRRPKPSSSEPPPKAESAGKAKIPATEGQRLVDACNREAFQYLCQPWYGDHKAQLARQVDDTLAAGIRVTVEDIRAAMLLASKTYREARANGTSASSTPPPYLIGKSLTLIVADRGAELLDDAVVPHVQQRQRPKNIITGAEGNLLRREDFEDRSQWEIDV